MKWGKRLTVILLLVLVVFVVYLLLHEYAWREKQLAPPPYPPVYVEVYMESLCPDTRHFFLTSLHPAFEVLPDSMLQVNLVPFGRASFVSDKLTSKLRMSCQHGAKECSGNALHICAISHYPRQRQHLPFISCMFRGNDWAHIPEQAEKCSKKFGLDYLELQRCAVGEESTRLLQQAGNRTGQRAFIPWIVLDGDDTLELEQSALTNLTAVICQKYKGVQMSPCGMSP